MTEEELFSSIQKLNVNKDSTTWDERTFEKAPHKPFLLLSILDGIKIGWIQGPSITLSQDLIETFFTYWKQIIGENRTTTIALPFYHMKSEPFWELYYKDGAKPYRSSPSLGGLTDRLAYAEMDDTLFAMMQDEAGRTEIIQRLLRTYFTEELHETIWNIHWLNIGAYRYAEQLQLLAAEPFEPYHEKDEAEYSRQKKQQREHGFALTVRKNYNNRCAVCRSKVITPNRASLVEGAHIIPWNESRNDDPRNGLALCKTHHWMFDSYLLAVQPDYKIKLSTWLKKEGKQIDDTLAWDREEILLPKEERFLPNREALDDHYERFTNN